MSKMKNILRKIIRSCRIICREALDMLYLDGVPPREYDEYGRSIGLK